jgi:ABC-2 type transport system permease protein
MSQAEVAASAVVRAPRFVWTFGLLRSELVTTFRRWRTLALLGVLAAVPILVGIAVKLETQDGGGPGRGDGGGWRARVHRADHQQRAVPGVHGVGRHASVLSSHGHRGRRGRRDRGRGQRGDLRYLLVAPAGRTRLLLTKYATVMTFCVVATLVVALSALTVGALLFPLGDLTTISGTQISFAEGLGRALLIALVVAASLVGIAALGLFISTMTSSGIAAMATTVGLLITVQILDQIPQLHALQPYFFSHYWLSFADLMREPVYWDDLVKNLGLQALYAAVFGSAAWARFTAKDITA